MDTKQVIEKLARHKTLQKEKNLNFTMKKTGRWHLNPMIKANIARKGAKTLCAP